MERHLENGREVNRRSAGFQPAVSPISNRPSVAVTLELGIGEAPAGWKHCDTAGWKPATTLSMASKTLSLTLAGQNQSGYACPTPFRQSRNWSLPQTHEGNGWS